MQPAGELFTRLILAGALCKGMTIAGQRAERDSVIGDGKFCSDHFLLVLFLAFFTLGNCLVFRAPGVALFKAGSCLVLFTLSSMRNISIISRSGSMLSASSKSASAAR